MEERLIIDIDRNISVPEYELILCKPNKQELCVINANNIVYAPEFANIDELTFRVPLYIMDEHKKVKNPVFDSIKGDYLVQFNGSKYFIITNVKKESTESGEEYKSISCFSKEFELVNKNIVDYVADSRKLYDPLDTKDDNGLEWGIINFIEKLTSWKVDYVKPSLMDRRRSFNITRQNLIEVFKDIQTTYGCLFQFDTVNKLINIYEVTDLGVDRGLYISDDNYIKSITEDIKHNEIKTRLYLYGRDNISINKLNPTGTFYLDNFNFYKTTDYMSQGLIDALNNYDILLQSKQGEFEGHLSQLETLSSQLDTKENELFNLQVELAIINDNIDTKIKNGESYSSLNTQKTNKQNQINSKQSEINSLKNQIATVNNNISNLQNSIRTENNFTQAQLEELDYFIKEETYSDSNYTEENISELKEKGQEILAKISQPPIEFSIDIVDFLSIVECQHDWVKLVLGDIVTIQHESLGVDIQVRLVGYTHDVDSNSLTLKFSNRNSIDDPNVYLKDLLAQMSSTSTQVDFSRFKWNKYDEDKKSDIILYVDSELDAAKNKILAGRNQDVEVGERGIICKDPNNPNEQLRILNNILAMTNDGWNTAKLAITPQGLVAENIVGRLGVFAKLRSDQIIVGNDNVEKGTLDENISQAEQNAKNYTDQQVENIDLSSYAPKVFADGLMEISNDKGFVAYKDATKQEFTQLYPDGLYRVKIDGATEKRKEYFFERDIQVLGNWNYKWYRYDKPEDYYGNPTLAQIETDLNLVKTVQLPSNFIGKKFKVLIEPYTRDAEYMILIWRLQAFSTIWAESGTFTTITDVNGNVWDGLDVENIPPAIVNTGTMKIKCYTAFRSGETLASNMRFKIDVIA